MLLLIALLFAGAMVLGFPIAVAFLIGAIPAFVLTDMIPPAIAVQKLVTPTQSFPLLAVPLFILAGNLMSHTGITERLVRFARLLTGWVAGGLAQASIMLSLVMSGISGSAVADAAMEARLLGPSMQKQGYSKGFIAAILAFGSIITVTIPPSIGLILFGVVNEVSIGKLFMAGLVPGILLTIMMMITCWLMSKRNGYVADQIERPTLRELGRGFYDSFWALLFPVLLIVGFRYGVFTATEAGAVLVFYAAFIGIVVYRELDLKGVLAAAKASIVDIGMIMFIIMAASVIGYAVTIERAPQQVSQLMTSLTSDPVWLLMIVVVIMLVVGMFLEGIASILLITPIVMPVLVNAGWDPVHMGILLVTLFSFGGLTPPVGVVMFAVCGILDTKAMEYFKASLPLMAMFLIFFLLLVLFPELSLYLPRQVM